MFVFLFHCLFYGFLSDLNSPCIRVHSYLRVSPGMQKYIENVRARRVHAWERSKPPWLEGRRPYVGRLYMYAYVQHELAMVYVRVSGYYFVNTDYVEPTRQSAQRGGPEHSRGLAFEVIYKRPADTLTIRQRMSIWAASCFFNYEPDICTYFVFASRYAMELHLAGSTCHGRTAWEESQIESSVLDGAITTYVRPENVSAN